jgi:hypothetical protein
VEGTTFLLAVAIGPNFLRPAFLGFAISFFALFAHFSVYEEPEHRLRQKVVLAGLLSGVALTSRFNFGAYSVAVIGLDLMLARLLRSENGSSVQTRMLRSWSTIATFALSTLLSWIGVYLLFCGPHLVTAIKQSIIFPQQAMSGLRFIPLQFTTGLSLANLFPCSWFCFRLIVGRDQIPKRAVVPLALAVLVLVMASVQSVNPAVARDVTVAELASGRGRPAG